MTAWQSFWAVYLAGFGIVAAGMAYGYHKHGSDASPRARAIFTVVLATTWPVWLPVLLLVAFIGWLFGL